MRDVFVTVERNLYLSGNDSRAGHGFNGFMDIGQGDSSYYLQVPGRLALLGHLAEGLEGHSLNEATVLITSNETPIIWAHRETRLLHSLAYRCTTTILDGVGLHET
jgi:hypothetical protein